MLTLGIDLASQREKTAACLIEWKNGRAIARDPFLGCSDDDLDALIAQADVVGIDAPFGWPVEFTAAVADWQHTAWTSLDDLPRAQREGWIHVPTSWPTP
jgi:predicted nuclease with RNAse H fold